MHLLESQLEQLRGRLLEMGALVESAILRSVSSLVERDGAKARRVLQDEAQINRLEIEIDEWATRLLALEQPLAGDLRLITAAIKINNDLERIGDHAVNIAEQALILLNAPPVPPHVDVPRLASMAQAMLHKALNSFVNRDAALARSVLTSDDAVDDLRDTIYRSLSETMEQDPSSVRPSVALIFVARNLERIADHATNIAEDVLFLVEGVEVRHHMVTDR